MSKAVGGPSSDPWLNPLERDRLIDSWSEVAGVLPAREFEMETFKNGKSLTVSATAREKVSDELGSALAGYNFAPNGPALARRKKLLKNLRLIERASAHLLDLVQRDADAVRDYYGLRYAARFETERIKETLEKTNITLNSQVAAMLDAQVRVRASIEAVEALRRWGKLSADATERRIERMAPRKHKSPKAHHLGNVGLNSYIRRVVLDCWCGVWGHEIIDGPRLWKFVQLAATAVGVPLSVEASRERIRRIFNLRRVHQRHARLDLPSIR